jgi:hypothetical protein
MSAGRYAPWDEPHGTLRDFEGSKAEEVCNVPDVSETSRMFCYIA